MTQPALYIKSYYSRIYLDMIVYHLCCACKQHILPDPSFGWSNTSTHWEIIYLPAAACARPVWKVMLETQSNNTICCRVWAGVKSQFTAVWEQREWGREWLSLCLRIRVECHLFLPFFDSVYDNLNTVTKICGNVISVVLYLSPVPSPASCRPYCKVSLDDLWLFTATCLSQDRHCSSVVVTRKFIQRLQLLPEGLRKVHGLRHFWRTVTSFLY